MNPHSEVQRNRLFGAIKHHYKVLSEYRDQRRNLISAYAGSLYGDSKKRDVVIPLMNQACEALMLVLAGSNPRYLITPRRSNLRGFARHYQETMNRLVVEIHLAETLQQVARDAFFGAGYVKTYLADAPLVEIEQDVWMDPGQPFASRISPDDHVYDTSVKDYRMTGFACDRYELPYHWLVQDTLRFDPEVVAKLPRPDDKSRSERAEQTRGLAHGDYPHNGEEWEPTIELVDVYLADYGLICTWATNERFELINTEPLAVQEWEGPETGPYRMLNLGPVPDNVMPAPPAQHVKFLFDLINSIYRKLSRQARRAKQQLVYQKGDEKDADRIRKAPDGEALGLTNPEAAKVLQYGNVDNNLLATGIHVLQQFDQAAGNLSARSGLGPSSGTLGQDELIQAQVGRQESATQRRMLDFTSGVGSDLGFLLFTDPVKTMDVTSRVPGTDLTYTQRWEPNDREGNWDDYDFDVEPHSMEYRSPQQRSQDLELFVQRHAPFQPFMERQGIGLDWWEYLEMQAELRGEPRLRWLYKAQGRPIEHEGYRNEATQSPVTQRTQIRQNQPSRQTQQGADQQLMQRAMSQGNNGQTQGAA